MASSMYLGLTLATVAIRSLKSRSAVLAAMPVLSERVALAATLLGERAVTAATAATAGRLMAAARLVAMAVLAAAEAATRSEELASSEEMAATAPTGQTRSLNSRAAVLAEMPVI